MFHQVTDFCDESEALFQLLESLSDVDFERCTQFKSWSINNIVGHLHMWNRAADLALVRPDDFQTFLAQVMPSVQQGELRAFEQSWLDGLAGRALRDAWRAHYLEMCEHFRNADPKARVAWAGPDMSVLSSITARLMETWAHGQAVYDLLGVNRVDTDRIRNIVVLGTRTFGWAFRNRGLAVPDDLPLIRLSAPSGDVWMFNDVDDTNVIEGSASEFCQVVTQVRNVADTKLTVKGDVASEWMSIAQCFAGPPEDPPAAGTRYVTR